MLNVCVSASSTDGALTTTAFLRSVLGATSTGDDAYQQSLIVAASRWAEGYVGYPLLSQVYSETLPGFGGSHLTVSRYPVRVMLRLFDSTSTNDATEFCSTDYRLDQSAGFIHRDEGWQETAGQGVHLAPYVVPNSEREPFYTEYHAGYVWPGLSTGDTAYSTALVGGTTSTAPTLPEDIQLAVALKAREFSDGDANVLSKSIGDFSVTYKSESGGNYRGPAERILDQYRKAW